MDFEGWLVVYWFDVDRGGVLGVASGDVFGGWHGFGHLGEHQLHFWDFVGGGGWVGYQFISRWACAGIHEDWGLVWACAD